MMTCEHVETVGLPGGDVQFARKSRIWSPGERLGYRDIISTELIVEAKGRWDCLQRGHSEMCEWGVAQSSGNTKNKSTPPY